MQIVINLPEDLYKMCKNCLGDADIIESAIAHGIPLPKGHGRLIDADNLEFWKYKVDAQYFEKEVIDWSEIKSARTIIEADKEDE